MAKSRPNPLNATGSSLSAAVWFMLASVEQLKADRKRIDEVANLPCRFGNIPIGDCEYVQGNMVRLDTLIAEAGTSTSIEIAQRDQQSAEMRDAAERMSQRLRQLTAERDTLLKAKTDLETNRTSLNNKATALPKRLQSVLRWYEIVTDSTTDDTLAKFRTEQTDLQTERTSKTAELSASLAEQSQHLGNLQRVFGALVAGVLNPEFRGTARIHDGEIECSITHGSVLAGEAVETLSVLLTDLACLLLGIEQNCQHPGLHIHDSPREADLGTRIYRQFLDNAAALHKQLGGQNSAPFQYIVTTTTAPPSALQANEYVALRLSNENETELLLGRSLGEPAVADAAADSRTLWD